MLMFHAEPLQQVTSGINIRQHLWRSIQASMAWPMPLPQPVRSGGPLPACWHQGGWTRCPWEAMHAVRTPSMLCRPAFHLRFDPGQSDNDPEIRLLVASAQVQTLLVLQLGNVVEHTFQLGTGAGGTGSMHLGNGGKACRRLGQAFRAVASVSSPGLQPGGLGPLLHLPVQRL